MKVDENQHIRIPTVCYARNPIIYSFIESSMYATQLQVVEERQMSRLKIIFLQ